MTISRSAAAHEYQRLAREVIADVHARGRVPVLVGGSGLYLRGVLDRVEFPGESPELRARLEAELETVGPATLHARLAAVDAEAAQFLAGRGVRVVGVDYLSVAPFGNTVDTHRTLLQAGVWVIEGLDLREVGEGRYEMVALPLKLVGSDASPLRVLLRPA